MYSDTQRQLTLKNLKRTMSYYEKEDVYCAGKIRFNFQINTTVKLSSPFDRETAVNYEKALANYMMGAEAHIATNGGGVVIIRGGTGAGKTTAVQRAVKIAKGELYKQHSSSALDVIWLEFNNLQDALEIKEPSEFRIYIWRELASKIDDYLNFKGHEGGDDLPFLLWLDRQDHIKNRLIPGAIDPDSFGGFPCMLDRDSPWRTEGVSPWQRRLSFGRTTQRTI